MVAPRKYRHSGEVRGTFIHQRRRQLKPGNMRREAVLSSDCMGAPVWPFLVRDPEVMNEITTFIEMSQILHFLPFEQ